MAKIKPLQRVRGTYDVLPAEQKYWRFVEEKILRNLENAAFERIDLPIFEDAFLFSRSIGESTDIIEKEMYLFRDRGDNILALRPEGTASVVRAYIEHGMHTWTSPVKLYYAGPMFRYERPQAGRWRQFYQIGFEVLGEIDPLIDAEILALTYNICSELGLGQLIIQINSIGCRRCRPKFITKLVDYVSERQELFCIDCLRRIKNNPLRVLDCKNSSCQKALEEIPSILDSLCSSCHDHFKRVLEYLDELELPYNLNTRLVRGLDYYTKTVFELWSESGGQSALAGGGRYDDLVELLGGKDTPACGCAFGIERLIEELQAQNITIPEKPLAEVFVACLGEETKIPALKIINQCRKAGIATAGNLTKTTLKAQLKIADKLQVPLTLILGQKELIDGTVIVRHMEEGVQETIEVKGLVKEIKKRLKEVK